jgi:hypothetical protein
VQEEPLDAAVVDGSESGVPLVVAIGYSEVGLPPEFASMPRLAKPFAPEQLVALVGSVVGD